MSPVAQEGEEIGRERELEKKETLADLLTIAEKLETLWVFDSL